MTAGTARAVQIAWSQLHAVGMWMVQVFLSAGWATLLATLWYDGSFPDPAPIWFVVAGLVPLWLVYGGGSALVASRLGPGPVAGLRARWDGSDFSSGVLGGAVLQIAILPVLYWPILRWTDADPGASAEDLVDRIDGAVDLALFGFAVVVAAPVVEELFFRGLLMRSLERYGPGIAVFVSSVLFALVHLQPIAYPGTFLLGVVAAVATLRTDRLAAAWGLHVGFNGATFVMLTALAS